MSTSVFFDRRFPAAGLHIRCFGFASADFRQLLRPWKQFFHKTVTRIFLMILHHSQDVFQISEGIQVIRLCCFRNAVDDRTGFRTIDTVDQFPCMFVQAEAAERSFRYVVIKGSTTVSIRNTFSASS